LEHSISILALNVKLIIRLKLQRFLCHLKLGGFFVKFNKYFTGKGLILSYFTIIIPNHKLGLLIFPYFWYKNTYEISVYVINQKKAQKHIIDNSFCAYINKLVVEKISLVEALENLVYHLFLEVNLNLLSVVYETWQQHRMSLRIIQFLILSDFYELFLNFNILYTFGLSVLKYCKVHK